MNLIVAVDEKWGIGKGNGLLISIPEDMQFFRTMTKNSPLIMGRKTLESFPNGNPLKNRLNIVLSEKNIEKEVLTLHSVEEVLSYINEHNLENVFVIGGGSVYKQFLPYCNVAYVTKMYKDFEAEIFMPNLDEMTEWKVIEKSEIKDFEGLKYQFCTYKKTE